MSIDLGLLVGLVSLIITLIAIAWKTFRYVSGIENRLDKLVENTASINAQIKSMNDRLVDSLIETVKRLTGPPFVKTGNPLTPEKIARRDRFLERGRIYGLSPNEVQELRAILEEGAKEAAAGNFLALVGFLFLIGLLLSALSEK